MTTVLTDEQAKAVHAWLAEREEQIVADIADYVRVESPSDDVNALAKCLDWLEKWLDERLGQPESRQVHERQHAGDISIRRYAGEGEPLLLLAHYDTVWPLGTIEQIPFQRTGDTLTGPGVFDMKAGLVQAVWALRALDALELPRPAFALLLNGDEETGSKASSDVIRAEAGKARAALCFEASAEGAIKTSRKGVGLFTLTVTGEEGHAGLDPTSGSSAVHEIAHQIVACRALQDLDAGTSVNIGVVHGGTRPNVTAGSAVAELDVRVASVAEQDRISAGLAALSPVDPKAKVEVTGGWNRPVFERTGGVAELFALARECAAPLGLDLREIAVGGASDGNFALDAGIPVLDGIGAVGAGAHARSEHATVSGMIERAAVAAGVLAALAR
ncbi:M20 family metallopeptidase [Saccharopolyspora sp. K220]|uniref:M20 family metallopeptidase n=1 Tax=Saccharopolyspora soli TaxID=2926618 RepID=UPI001F573A7B|nr:M20 family metallopeptidase [Saccharopolyspora soli]MCI2420802.1 M20 family metallopeptidase [Saccharopolyspora soli]